MLTGGAQRMTTAPITAIGSTVNLVLPQEVVDRLQVVSGDSVKLVETEKGYEIQRLDEELREQLAAFDQVMREDEQALRRLAE
jgi:putative addiction module antidote